MDRLLRIRICGLCYKETTNADFCDNCMKMLAENRAEIKRRILAKQK